MTRASTGAAARAAGRGRRTTRRARPGRRPARRPAGRAPALLSSASPEASSTTPSARRSRSCGSRVEMCAPNHTPGIEPIRSVPASPKSTLPETRWASAATHSSTAAWATSVPTTRCGLSRKPRMRPMAISVPEPADVMPSTKPIEPPSATAATLCRVCIRNASRSRAAMSASASARSSTSAPVSSSAPPIDEQHERVEVVARGVAQAVEQPDADQRAPGTSRRPARTPSAGTRCPCVKCRQPPTVLVTAA